MPSMKEIFSRVRRRWLAATLERDDPVAVRAYTELQESLRTDHALHRLSMDLYSELAGASEQQGDGGAELHVVNQMLQVMESVWQVVRRNRAQAQLLADGWMNVFRRWSNSQVFRRHWLRLRGEYSKDFLRFCELELNLSPGFPRAVLINEWPWPNAISALEREFRLEWPTINISDWMGLAGRDNSAWVITVAESPQNVEISSTVVCGMILSWEIPSTWVQGVEFFVWMRGAYRNLGIGRGCVGPVLERLWDRYYPKQDCMFRVRYPGGIPSGPLDSVRRVIWMNFFYHYNFRPSPLGQISSPEGVTDEIVLERHSSRERRRRYARWFPVANNPWPKQPPTE